VTRRSDQTVIVVPCFNEANRIDERAFAALADSGDLHLLFVDDGSSDATPSLLARLAQSSDLIDVFTLPENAGKAEAVRRGLLMAIRGGATIVGYYDADLATPPAELLRLTEVLQSQPDLAGVFGSRVARLGSSIERSSLRHYLGRTYATLASMALGITVYDTQCGAKVFRVSDSFAAALAAPFRSTWAFDVDLLYRLLRGSGATPALPVTAFVEVPLDAWRDVRGSKIRVGAAAAMLVDLASIVRSRRTQDRAAAERGAGAAAPVVAAPGPYGRRRGPGARSRSGREQPGRRRA
jgi:glycosyltransferase involved in cell wall biosynthesis